MKNSLYSIKDNTAEYFTKMFPSPNDATALRTIKNTLIDPNSKELEFVKNPDQFTLYKIGSFDDNTGEITPELTKMQTLQTLNEELQNAE